MELSQRIIMLEERLAAAEAVCKAVEGFLPVNNPYSQVKVAWTTWAELKREHFKVTMKERLDNSLIASMDATARAQGMKNIEEAANTNFSRNGRKQEIVQYPSEEDLTAEQRANRERFTQLAQGVEPELIQEFVHPNIGPITEAEEQQYNIKTTREEVEAKHTYNDCANLGPHDRC